MSKIRRAEIIITDSIKVGGWELDGSYYMSGTDATKVLDKHRESLAEFVNGKTAKALSHIDMSSTDVSNPEGKGSRVTLYTTSCVLAYWGHWAQNGNSRAFESLVPALVKVVD